MIKETVMHRSHRSPAFLAAVSAFLFVFLAAPKHSQAQG
jgi:hypothetical protein